MIFIFTSHIVNYNETSNCPLFLILLIVHVPLVVAYTRSWDRIADPQKYTSKDQQTFAMAERGIYVIQGMLVFACILLVGLIIVIVGDKQKRRIAVSVVLTDFGLVLLFFAVCYLMGFGFDTLRIKYKLKYGITDTSEYHKYSTMRRGRKRILVIVPLLFTAVSLLCLLFGHYLDPNPYDIRDSYVYRLFDEKVSNLFMRTKMGPPRIVVKDATF